MNLIEYGDDEYSNVVATSITVIFRRDNFTVLRRNFWRAAAFLHTFLQLKMKNTWKVKSLYCPLSSLAQILATILKKKSATAYEKSLQIISDSCFWEDFDNRR